MTDDLADLNTSRRIELVPVTKLKLDPKNPKSHSLGDIDDSYGRFGVVDLITLDERTGFILSGHGRATVLLQAFRAGDEAPEGITIDPATNEWLVPVVSGWASRNDAEAAAALISMNRLTELGGWADEALLDLLDEISEAGADFTGVGFSETDQDDLRALLDGIDDHEDDKPQRTAGGGGAKAVSIKLSDPGLIDFWHNIRDEFKTDDEAFRSMAADLGEVIEDNTPVKVKQPRKKTSKASTQRVTTVDPTLDDIGDEVAVPLAEIGRASRTAPVFSSPQPVQSAVETDDSGDPIIDWDNLPDGADEDE